MKKNDFSFLIVIAVLYVLITPAYSQVYQDTIYIDTDGIDSYVNGASTGTNYGTSNSLSVFWNGSTATRTFIKADLSTIPPNAIVRNAQLYLYALSVNNSSSHPMYVQRVLANWTETGITYSNQPSVTAAGAAAPTHAETSSTGWQNMRISGLVQHSINYPAINYGWRISLQAESGGGSKGVTYASSEHGTSAQRPYLVVQYVLPMEISGTVNHCSSNKDDGSIINIGITKGSSTYASYEWFHYNMGTVSSIQSGTNMATINIDSLEDGLYLLTVVDSISVIRGYKYFLVGEYGDTTTVDFRNNTSTTNSQLFNEDATFYYDIITSDGTAVTGNSTILHASTASNVQYASLLKYNVDFDSIFSITAANLRLVSAGHFKNASPPTTDSGYVSRVTNGWSEQVVTWNTRPSITTSGQKIINETSPAGQVTRNDTINILDFVQYWQENPDENHGIDIRLKHYAQAASAYLRYGSYDQGTAANRPSFLLSYSLPQQITTNFFDSLDLGAITVSAPQGDLPYKYFISYDTLPELVDVWDIVKDSINLDSMTFFQGDINSRTYTFENLPSNRYFIGVYDNNGDLILMEEALLTPDIIVFDSTDLDVSGDTLLVKSAETSAQATLLALLPDNEIGGFEIKIVTLDDDLRVGFNNVDDPFPFDEGDYNYSLKVLTNGKVYFYHTDTIVDSTTVIVGDRLAFIRELDSIFLYKNNIKAASDYLEAEDKQAWKVESQLLGPSSKLVYLLLYGSLKVPKLTFSVHYFDCGEFTADVQLTASPSSYFGISVSSYYVKDHTYATIHSGAGLPTAPLSLSPGIYNLYYVYSVGTYSFSVYINQIAVGYPIIWKWDPLTDNITPVTPSVNTITPTSVSSVANASSYNYVSDAISTFNWVQFETQGSYPTLVFTKYPPTVFWISYEEISLKFDNGDHYARVRIQEYPFGIINRHVFLYSGIAGTVLEHNYSTSSLLPFRLEFPTDGSGNFDFVEFFQGADLKHDFGTNSTGTLKVHAKELGNVFIKNTIASFCYPVNNYVAKTKPYNDGSYFTTGLDGLNFQYTGEYNQSDLIYELTNEAGTVISTSNYSIVVMDSSGELKKNADNRYTLDMQSLLGGFYLLTITNVKGERHYLRVKH